MDGGGCSTPHQNLGFILTNINLLTDKNEDVVLFFAALIVFLPEEIIICHFWEMIRKLQQL